MKFKTILQDFSVLLCFIASFLTLCLGILLNNNVIIIVNTLNMGLLIGIHLEHIIYTSGKIGSYTYDALEYIRKLLFTK